MTIRGLELKAVDSQPSMLSLSPPCCLWLERQGSDGKDKSLPSVRGPGQVPGYKTLVRT